MNLKEIKYFTSKDSWLETSAIAQLEIVSQFEGVRAICAFPDLHPGKGIAVGAAVLTEKYIYPHLLGNDIGCGMALFHFDCQVHDFKPEKLMKKLNELEELAAITLPENLTAGQTHRESLGTIGGGNHFAEFQKLQDIYAPQDLEESHLQPKTLFLMVHSGSRGLGELVFRRFIEEYQAQHGLQEGSKGFTEYLLAVEQCVNWAKLNRVLIAHRISEQARMQAVLFNDIPHNILSILPGEDTNYYLHRKGTAVINHNLIHIAGTRGDCSYLVKPLVNNMDNLYSLAHGAGRKWARGECKGRLETRFTKKTISSHAITGSRIVCHENALFYEEAPQAYKKIEQVIADLQEHGLVKVVATLKPLLTVKI